MSEDREVIIQKILEAREERKELELKMQKLNEQKEHLGELHQLMQATIADHAARELEIIDNERAYISQKSVHDEEKLKADFEQELANVLKEKEELEHRLEAESEYVSRHLKDRLSVLHQKTLTLRSELTAKTHEVTETLLSIAPDDAMKLKIQANQTRCNEIANKIAEAHREIEGMTAKAARLTLIQEKLNSQLQQPKRHKLTKISNSEKEVGVTAQ